MARLTPFPKFRALDSNGDPLAGGKLYTYEAGTSTPKTTWTTQAEGTPNANPVILDANGEADVWLDGSYKLQLDNSSDVTQWTIDNVTEEFPQALNDTLSPDVGASSFMLEVSGTINEAASGTHALLGGIRIQPPTINAGAALVTETASLYISNAPSAVGATNYALHVDAGATQLDGTLTVEGTTTLNDLLTVNQDVVITNAVPQLGLVDSDAATDAAINGELRWERGTNPGTPVGHVKFFSSDIEIRNYLASGDIIITLNSGDLIANLPTSAPATQHALWNNAGVVNIVL